MPRYVAFLRGVSPMNASMTELARCLETAGFDVKTVLASGERGVQRRRPAGRSPRAAMRQWREASRAYVTKRTWATVRRCASA
jgi:hypothetical protein